MRAGLRRDHDRLVGASGAGPYDSAGIRPVRTRWVFVPAGARVGPRTPGWRFAAGRATPRRGPFGRWAAFSHALTAETRTALPGYEDRLHQQLSRPQGMPATDEVR